MPGSHLARRVYSAEQLYQLRSSCSAPKLSEAIEEHVMDDAEVVKEHVLRGSRSFAARSLRSRNGLASLRVPSDRTNNENVSITSSEQPVLQLLLTERTVLGEVSSNNNQVPRAIPGRLRPSPTPSLKRKKAEAIVKAHGSPTHVRVTAGGRIVPSEQSPLCLPRFGYSAVKVNGGLIKFAPNHHVGKTLQWGPTAHDGSQNGFVAQDVEGRLYQIVNGTILPLAEVDGGLRLYIPAPNLNITERGFSNGSVAPMQGHELPSQERACSQASVSHAPQPSVAAQINALELEYAKFDLELKDLDKTEVIHGKSMGRSARDALVAKRRELVIALDRIRKAIKAFKERPASTGEAIKRPQTPKHRSQSDRSSLSPSIAVNAPFAARNGHGDAMQSAPFALQTFFGQAPFVPHSPSFGHAQAPANDMSFMGPSFMMPPMGYFMNPPPFDGQIGWLPPFQPYAAFADNPTPLAMLNQSSSVAAVPQHDGTSSAHDIRSQSPRPSHALTLKDPETKKIVTIKSLLNPMSPVYRPSVDGVDRSPRTSELDQKTVRDRPPTPLSFTNLAWTADARSGGHSQQSTRQTNTTSSGSSIRTLDFFPHNARDHSMRKHEYAPSTNGSDKENMVPKDSARASSDNSFTQQDVHCHDGDWSLMIPASSFLKSPEHAEQRTGTPNVPANTAAENSVTTTQSGASHAKIVGHRHAHFLSGGHGTVQPSSTHNHDGASSVAGAEESVQPALIDFSGKPRMWIEGYQAGLFRRPIGADRMGDFLDGYCSGLLKSQPCSEVDRASPSRHKAEHGYSLPSGRHQLTPVPLELANQSKDCLKEAIYAPNNEDAILTPALDGPSIEEAAFNLGAWQKQHDFFMSADGQGLAGFPFPRRTSSIAQVTHEGDTKNQPDATLGNNSVAEIDQTQDDVQALFANVNLNDSFAFDPAIPDKNTPSIISIADAAPSKDRRSMLNQGKRIISPLEWRTRNSLASVVNMTSSLFAHTQFDGQPGDKVSVHSDREPMLSSAAEISGSPSREAGSRFKEISLDGISPPLSPEPMSPPVSPRASPLKLFKNRRSPAKEHSTRQSPGKTKLEHYVNKVNIKVSPEKVVTSGEHGSPSGKRHWKDLWKGTRTASGKREAI